LALTDEALLISNQQSVLNKMQQT